jgi:hypothetical protein
MLGLAFDPREARRLFRTSATQSSARRMT